MERTDEKRIKVVNDDCSNEHRKNLIRPMFLPEAQNTYQLLDFNLIYVPLETLYYVSVKQFYVTGLFHLIDTI